MLEYSEGEAGGTKEGLSSLSPLGVFTESLPAPAVPRRRLPHGDPRTGAQSPPGTVQSVQRGLLVRECGCAAPSGSSATVPCEASAGRDGPQGPAVQGRVRPGTSWTLSCP